MDGSLQDILDSINSKCLGDDETDEEQRQDWEEEAADEENQHLVVEPGEFLCREGICQRDQGKTRCRRCWIFDEAIGTWSDRMRHKVESLDCSRWQVRGSLLLIECAQASLFIRFVAVEFTESLLERHRQTLEYLVDRFMPFLVRPTSLALGEIESERLNFKCVIREMRIKTQSSMPERAMLPLIVAYYNGSKSGVDTLHEGMGGKAGALHKEPHAGCF